MECRSFIESSDSLLLYDISECCIVVFASWLGGEMDIA